MIRVTVELLPFGYEGKKRIIGTANVWNDGTGSKKIGNYGYKLFNDNKNKVWKKGKNIDNFPRLKLKVWDLLFRVLKDAVESRNK